MALHTFNFEWGDEITDRLIDGLVGCLKENKEYSLAHDGKGYMDVPFSIFSTGDGIIYNIGIFLDKVELQGFSSNEQTVRLWALGAEHADEMIILLIGVLKRLDLWKPIREECDPGGV